MSLTAKQRRKLPTSDFALPSKIHRGPSGKRITKGAYPDDTKARARNALSRASQNASPAEQAEIRKRVHAKYPSIGASKKGAAGRRKSRQLAKRLSR